MADAPQPFAYVVLVLLTALSGCFSGLNLGLMSLTVEDLNIVVRSSTDPLQVEHAKKILPLRKRGNMLLCTLLIGNTVVNVMLAVVTDPIWVYICGSGIAGQIFALALPSALIVVFGEIVPQSVCSRYALSIGARTLPLTYVFVVITFPFASLRARRSNPLRHTQHTPLARLFPSHSPPAGSAVQRAHCPAV
jgi:metal transporter CNNM